MVAVGRLSAVSFLQKHERIVQSQLFLQDGEGKEEVRLWLFSNEDGLFWQATLWCQRIVGKNCREAEPE